jgi:methyl-accepting chemotaxis protein
VRPANSSRTASISSDKLVVQQVGDINANVAAIVEAARDQSVGLKEINIAVNSMDQATQQNAAMAEENTAASTDLASQAGSLQHAPDQFKTGRHVAVPSAGDRHASISCPRPAQPFDR